MEYLRTVFDRTHIKLLISAGISLLLGLVLLLIGTKVSSALKDQQFARRWSDKSDCAQVTVFFSELAGFDADGVKELKYKIDNKLLQDSITTESEDARLWVYAYSANGEVMVSSNNSESKVRAIGVGGDYFLFHPLELLSGSFFESDYYMKDVVLIDEETAWRLFGSNDVEGQLIEIGGTLHVVGGVVKKESGRMQELAGNDEPILYMSYESLAENGMVSYINSYEALLPNPISSYGMNLLTEVIPCDSKRYEIVENTGRFNFVNLIKHVKNFGTRGMNAKGVIYPYWENVARGTEDFLVPAAVLGCLFLAYPIIIIICILIRMWQKRTIRLNDVRDFIEDIDEKRRMKKARKKGDIYVKEIE